MLRRLDLKHSWRSLDEGFWPDDLPFGYATVIYGHNGSGKSTLAELLLSLAEDRAATSVVWEHADKKRSTISAGGSGPSPAMAVFTREWVEANLSEFLAGENAEAIVTLGQEAIDSKEAEKELEDEVRRLLDAAVAAEERRKKADRELNGLVRDVQNRIVNELQRFDYSHYTKSRYSVVKVSEALRAPRNDYPDESAHADALVRLGDDAPTAIREIAPPPAQPNEGLQQLAAVLARTPTRVALTSLESDPQGQNWVEQGLALHQEQDQCLFCGGDLTTERRQQLARHFDESWLRIRAEAKKLLTLVTRRRGELTSWFASLPTRSSLASDHQSAYELAVEQAKREVDERVMDLDRIAKALDAKVDDPSATPAEPTYASLAVSVATTVLSEAVKEHNEQAQRHEELTTERKAVVFDHIVGSRSQVFRDLEKQVEEAKQETESATSAAALAEDRLERVRQEQFTTKEMADKLTRDLARVYGKKHLSIDVTDDGKSYSCRRGDKPGTNLSEGERTTLSLLYFLRTLEDQQTRGADPRQRIVVVDDPSSSLDREALFATHEWLFSTLKKFGQYVVLTHDFNLLRLFISSHNNKWSASAKAIAERNPDEICFPRVAFLEMFATTVEGEPTTKIDQLPSLLRNSTSEYAYLFSAVMKGVEDTEDHERLFLLPNAARRVLEVFASYKAPHRPNFHLQLEELVQADPDQPFRDVYDFCNRFSHGEGSETVEVLDARAVHGQIRRCMQLLRAVDGEHFENMCKAVKVDPAALP